MNNSPKQEKKQGFFSRLPRKAKIAGLAATVLSAAAPCFNRDLLISSVGYNAMREIERVVPLWDVKTGYAGKLEIVGSVRHNAEYLGLDVSLSRRGVSVSAAKAYDLYGPVEPGYELLFMKQISLP